MTCCDALTRRELHMPDTDLAGAGELLSQWYASAIVDAEGKCVRAGFVITEAANGKARIYHRLPVPDYTTEALPTSDELDAERHRMTVLYSEAFTEAGWCVHKRGGRSAHPHLLASRQPWIQH